MPGSIRTLFSDHPHSVGESYGQHARHALGFGFVMGCGAVACFVHAAFPFLHVRTGSQAVVRLHERMVINRRKQQADEMRTLDPSDSIAENI